MWYVGAGLFFIAAVALAIGSQWAFGAAALAIALALLVLGIVEGRKAGGTAP
jgi:hypothetical protein